MNSETYRHRAGWILIAILLALSFLILAFSKGYQVGYEKMPSITKSPTDFTPTPSATLSPNFSVNFPITSTASITATITVTITETSSPTRIITPTLTVTPIITPTDTPTATPNPFSYLPLIIREPTPLPYIQPETELFCDSLSQPVYIPDNDPNGTSDSIWISDPRLIVDLDIALKINHSWTGDVIARLTHLDSGKSIDLIDRLGYPSTDQGCSSDNIATVLDDEISSAVEWKCALSPAAVSGIYIPNQSLSIFDGDSIGGSWRLDISDHYKNDTGYLSSWCLVGKVSPYGQIPTPTAPPPPAPPEAILSGVHGHDQALPLDCESRSAVDWAAYFGYSIGELSFFNQLPHSDNPDKGFVGNVFDPWGQIPPQSYGVHAEPVAELLRAYGVPAYAHRPLSWDALRAEIAAGRPVFVWIVGSVQNGIPVYYTPPDGLHTVVARYEHTVIVTGYSTDSVYFLNGDTIYSKSVDQFLDSWSALGNMAITALP